MKNFFDEEFWMWLKAFLIVLALFILAAVILFTFHHVGLAEGGQVWVLCAPDSFVCLRDNPRKSATSFGGSTCGTMLITDGKSKNGFLHIIDVPAESDTGWIYGQYIVYDEPILLNQGATVVSNGRLAARKGIGGKVRKWLQPMDTLTVIYWTDSWCLTNYGYVQSMYLELDGEG